jgi:RNA polymerase sigma-70 factor (ECF subfamily)
MIGFHRAPLTMLMTFQARVSPSVQRKQRFEDQVVPHLDAAYDLARWLTRSDDQAEDVVQTACVRALRFFDGFRGGSARSWLLAIVRNVFYTWHESNRQQDNSTEFDEEVHSPDATPIPTDPETQLIRNADGALLKAGIEALPAALRETLVLRELEGLSYREIAEVASVPIGTVMSRLSRARHQLQTFLIARGLEGTSR